MDIVLHSFKAIREKEWFAYCITDRMGTIKLSDFQETPEKAKQEAIRVLSDLQFKLNGMTVK
jgi:hypothetical protein